MDLQELQAYSQANALSIEQATKPLKRIITALIICLIIIIAGSGVCAYKFLEVAFDYPTSQVITAKSDNNSFINAKTGK